MYTVTCMYACIHQCKNLSNEGSEFGSMLAGRV